MKKTALLLLAVIFMTGMLLTNFTLAGELPLRVEVNGTKLIFPDAKPFIDPQGRTQTPARFIGEALGAVVKWDGTAKKATFEVGSKKLTLFVGKKEYDLNGQNMKMDTVALLKDGRIFVPARYVAEAFGGTVTWDAVVKTVYISFSNDISEDGPKVVGGFKVPEDTNVIVTKIELKEEVEAAFEVNLLRKDFAKQKADLKEMLLQKFESNIVDEIMAHINQKTEESYVLPGKFFYSTKNDQYIWVKESRFIDINVLVYVKGYKIKSI
ncbi:MAG: copper amine oxidase N-terminal domain-containing protein [Bacillota bacterium]